MSNKRISRGEPAVCPSYNWHKTLPNSMRASGKLRTHLYDRKLALTTTSLCRSYPCLIAVSLFRKRSTHHHRPRTKNFAKKYPLCNLLKKVLNSAYNNESYKGKVSTNQPSILAISSITINTFYKIETMEENSSQNRRQKCPKVM